MVFGEFQFVELIYGFLGSFFGLLLALLTDNFIAKREEKRKINTVLEAIHSELLGIADLIDDEENEEEVAMISTFVWKSVISSDFFSTVLHSEKEKCFAILKIYNGIHAFTNLQEKYSQEVGCMAQVKNCILESIKEFDIMMQETKK